MLRMRCHRSAAAAILLAVLAGLVFPGAAQAQSASPGAGRSEPGASVFFPEKAFEFPPVIDGVKVVHDFVVKNKGAAPLFIHDVRTG
jgi:hypothetical protein